MSAKKAVLAGLGIAVLAAGLGPMLFIKTKYPDKDAGAIQQDLTESEWFTGKKKGGDDADTKSDG